MAWRALAMAACDMCTPHAKAKYCFLIVRRLGAEQKVEMKVKRKEGSKKRTCERVAEDHSLRCYIFDTQIRQLFLHFLIRWFAQCAVLRTHEKETRISEHRTHSTDWNWK